MSKTEQTTVITAENTTEVAASAVGRNPLAATGWATASFLFGYIASAVLYIPLAWQLSTRDFGIYTVGSIFSYGIITVLELSLGRAFIRTPGQRDELAQTTFWLAIGGGFLGFLICGFSGWVLAPLYNEPQLGLIMWLLAPAVLAAALGSLPHSLLGRELDFRRKLFAETTAAGFAAILAIIAAFLGAGIYSLVSFIVVKNILNCGLAWRLAGWKPLLKRPSLVLMRRLLAFGLPAGGGEIANYIRFNVPFAIAGVSLGSAQIGLFNMAWNVSERPTLVVNSLFNGVGYATFAKLQASQTRLRQLYLVIMRLLACITLPLFSSIILIREEVVAVLGERWRGIIEPLLPLAVLQALWVLFFPAVALLLALGYSRLYALINLASLLLTITAVLIGSNFGIIGVAWAMLTAIGSTALTWGIIAFIKLRPTLPELWQIIKLPLLFCAVTIAAVIAAQTLCAVMGLGRLYSLAAAIVAFLLVFLLTTKLCWRTINRDIAVLKERVS